MTTVTECQRNPAFSFLAVINAGSVYLQRDTGEVDEMTSSKDVH